MNPTLLTFGPMIDCECSRLLLAHYGVAYTEAPHAFAWGSVLSVLHAATPQVPLLYGGGGPNCVGPRAIHDFYDLKATPERRLMPQESVQALQANADWARFNGTMAGSTATLAYYHLLPLRAIMMEPFCRGVPPFDVAFTKIAYPALAALLRLLLQISPTRAAESLDQIRRLFEETDRRIADGRPFLAGDTLTLGDFALASAAAPVLLPPGFAAPCPAFADFPPALQAVVVEMRQHPTGQFVTRFLRTNITTLWPESRAPARLPPSSFAPNQPAAILLSMMKFAFWGADQSKCAVAVTLTLEEGSGR